MDNALLLEEKNNALCKVGLMVDVKKGDRDKEKLLTKPSRGFI